MKYRNDFVTNSSSSSFILAFSDKDDGLSQISKLMDKYGTEYIWNLLEDFKDADPIPYEDLRERFDLEFESLADAELYLGSSPWYRSNTSTFEKRWMSAHPEASYDDYYNSDAYKSKIGEIKDRLFHELLNEIGDKRYLVEVEYEDHTEAGEFLEHNLLPECEFTAQRFSHH